MSRALPLAPERRRCGTSIRGELSERRSVTPLIVSPGPRLEWKALRPGRRRGETPAPFDTAPTHYVFSGRTAIFHGLRILGISSDERVLVPAFNCASLVEPILRHGAKVAFYKINTDCSADLDDLERRIDARTRAIVVIHYFGFPERLEPLRRLCATRSEEHTSELQSPCNLVCRLLLEKKKKINLTPTIKKTKNHKTRR